MSSKIFTDIILLATYDHALILSILYIFKFSLYHRIFSNGYFCDKFFEGKSLPEFQIITVGIPSLINTRTYQCFTFLLMSITQQAHIVD